MKEPNACFEDYYVVEKFNESEKIVNKYLVSGPPKTEPSFEIGGSINST